PAKFCDENKRTIYNTTIDGTLNFNLCLFYNDDVDIVNVNIQKMSYEWQVALVNESYLLLHINIDNIHESLAGDHTIEITVVNARTFRTQRLNRTLTLFFR
ncbi:hypothetical protein BgiBS90_018926, partial [Biomphalaria glabrata]